MPTRHLYYDQPQLDRFSASVLSCEEKEAGRWLVVLDVTAFYPEGGGQPADHGTLGAARVLDVHEKNGVIEHLTDAPLAVGATVEGVLDWGRRFSQMQHHTAEHIVSGLVKRHFGLNNVGFHMGSAMVTIDFDGPLTAEQLADCERWANEAVWQNRPVEANWPDADRLAALEYRSKKALEGAVRIVTVPEADCCACCGTHVATTGQIGLIRLLSPQSYKGGVRVGLLAGDRALEDYRRKDDVLSAIAVSLSVKPEEAGEAVARLAFELGEAKQMMTQARRERFLQVCEKLGPGDGSPLCLFEENLTPGELRQFCLLLLARRLGPCLVCSGDDENGYRYALGGQGMDARPYAQALHQKLGGKGGGSAELVQGAFAARRAEIEAVVR